MAKQIRGIHSRNRQAAQAWGTSVGAPANYQDPAYLGDEYGQGDNLYDAAWGPVESQSEAIAMEGYMNAQEPTGPTFPVKSTKTDKCKHCGK